MKKERKKRLERITRRAKERREERGSFVTGRISVTPAGFGFVKVEQEKTGEPESEVFVPPQFLNDALNGDTVKVKLLPPRPEDEAEKKGPAGRVVEVLKRDRDEFVGEIVSNGHVRTLDPRLPGDVVISGSRNGAVRGDWVKVKLLSSEEGVWRAAVRKRIGRAGEVAADLDAVAEEYHLEPRYTADFDREAEAIVPREIPREDHTAECVMTIDPFDAKDFDDALSVRPGPEPGTVELGIHISDVAAYIAPRSKFDTEAAKRGFTAYLPGRTLPMLPAALTKKISLHENADCFAHSHYVVVDAATGVVKSSRRIHSVIRVRKRLNYDEVQSWIDGATPPADWSTEVVSSLQSLIGVTRALRRRRAETEHFLHLEMPEIRILCDEKTNAILGLNSRISRESEMIVEECMLLANSLVGQSLPEIGVAGIYRIHPQPEAEKVAEFSDLMESCFGIVPGNVAERIPCNKFIESLPDDPRKPVILNLLLRTMMRASYAEKPALHFGLGKGRYVHFTSPIRRYTDLTVHQQLWNFDLKQRTRSTATLARIALDCTLKEENNDNAFFAASDRLKLRYLQGLLDAGTAPEFTGVVFKVNNGGLQVDLVELGLYAFVPLDFLPGAWERDGFALKAHRGPGRFQPGDCLKLRLAEIDFSRGSALLTPVQAKG